MMFLWTTDGLCGILISVSIGNYLGDVWELDFKTMRYQDMRLEGPDARLINRSNHTAVFYEKHHS